MCEINEKLAHRLVQDDSVTLFHELSDDLAFLVLYYENLKYNVHVIIEADGSQYERRKHTSSGLTIFSITTRRKFDSTSL